MTASCAAQLTAASDAGDPSTPTMIPKSFVVEDILIFFRQENAMPRLVKYDAMPRHTVCREALVLTSDSRWTFFVFCRHRKAGRGSSDSVVGSAGKLSHEGH
jgi:hypothetical protein